MRMEPLETLIFTWQMEKQECTITKGRQEAKKKKKKTTCENENCQWLVAKHTAISG